MLFSKIQETSPNKLEWRCPTFSFFSSPPTVTVVGIIFSRCPGGGPASPAKRGGERRELLREHLLLAYNDNVEDVLAETAVKSQEDKDEPNMLIISSLG